jgi:hypothetical protein
MQLDEPGTVGVCKDVALGTHVSELILLELHTSVSTAKQSIMFQRTISALTSDFRA